jgi:hypothetical protein
MKAIAAAGFNCVRVDINNISLHDSGTKAFLAELDDVVAAAATEAAGFIPRGPAAPVDGSLDLKPHSHESTDCAEHRLARIAKFVAPRFSGRIRNLQKARFDPTPAQKCGTARLEPEQTADLFRSNLPCR